MQGFTGITRRHTDIRRGLGLGARAFGIRVQG